MDKITTPAGELSGFKPYEYTCNRDRMVSPAAVPCKICWADEPHTGTCGSNDPQALCNQQPVKQSGAQAALAAKDADYALGVSILHTEIARLKSDLARPESMAVGLMRAEIATLTAERDALRKDAGRRALPDMVWDHDDAERCHGSIDEILNDTWNNGSLEIGAEFTVQQAIRLPNIKVRVTAIDEENGEIAYEEIDAAMTKEAKCT